MKYFVILHQNKVEMTYKKTYDVQKNNQLLINLPERFRSKKQVIVTIEDVDGIHYENINTSELPIGIYYYKIEIGKQVFGGKLLKME